MYLCKYRPFKDESINNLQIYNEYQYVFLSMHQLLFTDYVTDPRSKMTGGWSFVFFAILNLVFPNLWLVV